MLTPDAHRTAHGLASNHCPYFYGSRCTETSGERTAKRAVNPPCKLIAHTGAKPWPECQACPPHLRKIGQGTHCPACPVFHTAACAAFEELLLPHASAEARSDYRQRIAPPEYVMTVTAPKARKRTA